jgi:type II secretion system protein J
MHRPAPTTRLRQAGMTMIEVMIALGIIAVISTMIWAAFAQTSRNRKVIESSMDRYHQVTLAFEKIASDLSMAHLSKNVSQNEKRSITTEPGFIGRNEDPDRIDLTSFAHVRRYLNAKEDRDNRGTYNLVRREAVVVDEDPTKGGKTSVILEDVVEFDLEYYDVTMDKWEKEWDTTEVTGQAGRLPLQVRIYLTIHDEYGKEVSFATQVPLDVPYPIQFSGGGI